MFETRSQTILELLRRSGAVPRDELDRLEADSSRSGEPLAELVTARGILDVATLLKLIAADLGWDCEPEPPWTLPGDVVALVPSQLAREAGVMPRREKGRCVEVLAADPFNHQLVEDLAFALGREVRLLVCEPARVRALVEQYYGEASGNLDELVAAAALSGRSPAAAETLSLEELEALAGQTPIVRFVNAVLGLAIREQASDLHFEPFEQELKIRYRIDGVLREISPTPRSLALAITSRIKVLADLDIAERRVPQDGRIKLSVAGRTVDLRVSTLPTQFGESVVLRVLDQAAVRLELSQLGMPADVEAGVREIVQRPNGIFVVTGPTGSGKTTTLYSALRTINLPELKLLTAEDPVEYEIEGIMQVPVNPGIGLTFGSALRSFLRQDPDVVMVGEIRDLETAEIAIQASLTGHLVFSTLHTNDAAGAVTRLIDMGVEPYLLASTLEGVLAQRLVRRVCPHCRVACAPDEATLTHLAIERAERGAAERSVWQGRGCAHCGHTGYRGRRGIFEWLRITDPIRELITAHAPAAALRQKAMAHGMRTLRDDGLRAMFAGETTADEVSRYT